MAHIIAVCNHKGGVGKTTTTAHIAYLLAESGVRVLCVDMDSQANLLAHLFPFKIIRSAQEAGSSLATVNRSNNLSVVPFSFWEAPQNAYSQAIRNYAKDVDVVLIDCPPSLETRTLAALDVATHVLIPTHLDRFATMGLRKLLQEIDERKIPILGIFATMTNASANQVMWRENLEASYGATVLDNEITVSRTFSSAATQAKVVFEQVKKPNAAMEAYQEITNLLTQKLGLQPGVLHG